MTETDAESPVRIDVDLVGRLVADQFPAWADLPVRPVEIEGHDNRSFRLGDTMSVRMPSGRRYAAHVETEQIWLPKLARHLPLPIPLPLGSGKPAFGYPWPWSVNSWLEGENASVERIGDPVQFAEDLAVFLNALGSIDTDGAPSPGPDNFHRGGDLAVYDAQTRECIDELGDLVDTRAATAVWETALSADWSGPPQWFHGDVAADNLLVREGRLCAVIDFGQLAAGDPACDVTIAWTLFSGESRERFRAALLVDEATWSRGRGWGLWKALLELRSHRQSGSDAAARPEHVIADILADGVDWQV